MSHDESCADFLERIVCFLDNELDARRRGERACPPRRVRPVPAQLRPAAHREDAGRAVVHRARARLAAPAGADPDPGDPGPLHRELTRDLPRQQRAPARFLGAGASSYVSGANLRRLRASSLRRSLRWFARTSSARGVLGALRASSRRRSLRVVRTDFVRANRPRSGVGALAVVRGLLLAAATLASGLAHGVLLWSAPRRARAHPLRTPPRRTKTRWVSRSSTSAELRRPGGPSVPRSAETPTGRGTARRRRRPGSPHRSPAPDRRSAWRATTLNRCSRPSWKTEDAVTSTRAPTRLPRTCSSSTRVPTDGLPVGEQGERAAAQVAASHHASRRGVPSTGRLPGARRPPRCRRRSTVKVSAASVGATVSSWRSRRNASRSTPGAGDQSRRRVAGEAEPLRRSGGRRHLAHACTARRRARPRSRNSSMAWATRARPTPRPWAAGATASIRISPSPGCASSRHGDPSGQTVTEPSTVSSSSTPPRARPRGRGSRRRAGG